MRIKELRKLSGIKQAAFAKDMNVAQASVSEWENGKTSPSIDNLIAVARYFHVSVGCVVGEEPIPDGYPNHWPPKPLQEGDPIPAYIGTKQLRYAPPKPPFSDEQLSYIEEMETRISQKVLAAVQDGISLSKSQTGTQD